MLDRMAGGVPHQGLIAVVSAKPLLGLDELLDQARTPALRRRARRRRGPAQPRRDRAHGRGGGADGVVLPERHSAGLSETVARASAGALEHVKVAQIGNVAQALDRLKERGVWVVGFDAAGHRALGRGGPEAAGGARAGGRGTRHPAARARALRPPRLAAAVRSRRLAERVGGGRHRALRGCPPARRRAEPGAADTPERAGRRRRVWSGPPPDDTEGDPGRLAREARCDRNRRPTSPTPSPEGPLVVLDDEESAWWGSPATPAPDGNRSRRVAAGAARPAVPAPRRRRLPRATGTSGTARAAAIIGAARPVHAAGGGSAASRGVRGRRRRPSAGSAASAGGPPTHSAPPGGPDQPDRPPRTGPEGGPGESSRKGAGGAGAGVAGGAEVSVGTGLALTGPLCYSRGLSLA